MLLSHEMVCMLFKGYFFRKLFYTKLFVIFPSNFDIFYKIKKKYIYAYKTNACLYLLINVADSCGWHKKKKKKIMLNAMTYPAGRQSHNIITILKYYYRFIEPVGFCPTRTTARDIRSDTAFNRTRRPTTILL